MTQEEKRRADKLDDVNQSQPDVLKITQEEKRHWPKKEIFFGVLAVVGTVTFCVAAFVYKDDLMKVTNIESYSLLGMAIIAFLAGSILSFVAIPVPYWLLVFTLPSVLAPEWGLLAPVAVGLTSAAGTTIGHFPTFMLGYGGGKLSQRVTTRFSSSVFSRVYNRVIVWMQKHGAWAAFAMSAMFNPAHLPMTIAIGALRFPPPKFLLFSFLGNSVKSLFLAFAGYYGLTKLLPFIGVS
jgi:membrane protein DedA with SNARE-associated domain